MSPSSGRRKQAVPKVRERRELLIAVGGAAAVVLGTALLVWLMRPGASGTQGTGGIMNRQPRAAWLVGLTLGAAIAFLWWALSRRREWRDKFIILFLGGWVVLGLAAVFAGVLWPGGLLRHITPPPDLSDIENLTPTTLAPETETTIPGQTTAPTIPLPTLAPDSTVAPAPETTGSP
jgi:hypothetical protein